MKNAYASPSSSPPTPPSPLPISVGPGSQKYCFSSSPSPTPPFSPVSSPDTSSESLPLLAKKLSYIPPPTTRSSFSLDLQLQDASTTQQNNTSSSSCLKDLLLWLVLRCCTRCSLPI